MTRPLPTLAELQGQLAATTLFVQIFAFEFIDNARMAHLTPGITSMLDQLLESYEPDAAAAARLQLHKLLSRPRED